MNELDLRRQLDSIADGGTVPINELRRGVIERVRQRKRRRLVVVGGTASALAVVLVFAALAFRGGSEAVTIQTGGREAPVVSGTAPGSSIARLDPGDEGYVNPERESRYRGWLAEYDPREVAHLRSLRSDASDVSLVTTLEFRRACRVTNAAWKTSSLMTAAERELSVHRIMDPEIDRLNKRKPSDKSQGDVMFERLRDSLVVGDLDYVKRWVDTDCRDAFATGVTDETRLTPAPPPAAAEPTR